MPLSTSIAGGSVVSADPAAPEIELRFYITQAEDQRLLGKQIAVTIIPDSIELPEGAEWVNGSGLKMRSI